MVHALGVACKSKPNAISQQSVTKFVVFARCQLPHTFVKAAGMFEYVLGYGDISSAQVVEAKSIVGSRAGLQPFSPPKPGTFGEDRFGHFRTLHGVIA